MRLPYCDHHICAFLQLFEESNKPLDLLLSDYLRAHKSIGAHDRRTIGEILYGMVRWKTLIDYFSLSSYPNDRLSCFRKLSIAECQKNSSIPEPIRFGLPEFLYTRFKTIFGADKIEQLCHTLNTPAPTTIRVNTLKSTREEFLKRFEGKIEFHPCARAPHGLYLEKRMPLFTLPEFKEGLFEVQDEGSQLVAQLISPNPGEHVLDYCSGSGGKTLAFAPAMKGKGQIYLHDVRPHVLVEAKKRLNRAGIQNIQCLSPGHSQLPRMQGKMDWVLVDAPCSGTGTLRRNPDCKWKIDPAMIQRLVEQQREIVKEALPYLKTGGILVYATCSILPEENEEQLATFLKEYPLLLEADPLQLLPEEGGMDGFFAVKLRKK